jgi:hypothetical protein
MWREQTKEKDCKRRGVRESVDTQELEIGNKERRRCVCLCI